MSMPESGFPSGEVPSAQVDDLIGGGNPTEDVTESDEGLLLDSDDENNNSAKGRSPVQRDGKTDDYRYGDDGELDYDEIVIDNGPQTKEVEDEDEVKVHAIEDIEEGEVSSDEEGEIKESDDEPGGKTDHSRHTSKSRPTSNRPHPSNIQPSEAIKCTKLGKKSKDGTEQKSDAKKQRKREHKGKSSNSEGDLSSSSSGEHDERNEGSTEYAEKRRRARERSGPDSPDKVPTPCRHFMGGKCNWGNSCRFLHEKPKDVHKLSLHDRHGDPDVHGMLTDGPRVIPMGFHPGAGPMGHGIHPHGAPPPFMHGPGSLGLGHARDLPMHMDPMGGSRAGMPLPPHGRPVRGYAPPPHMRGPHTFIPMHERDLPPGRPFDLGRGPGRISDRQIGRGSPFTPFAGGPGKGGKIAEVTEETDGWMRLRTVTQDWSSDEENGERVDIDLRDKILIKRGDKDSNSDHEGKTRPVKGTSEEWVDPWARDKRSEKEKTAKTKRAPQKRNSSEESLSSDSERKMVRTKQMSKARNKSRSPAPSKGHKRSEGGGREVGGSSDGEDRSKKSKMRTKKSPPVKSKQTKMKRNEMSSEEVSEEDSHGEREARRRRQDGAKKRKRWSKEDESSSDKEDKKKINRSKHPRTRDSMSPTDDPRHFGNLRDDYFRPHPFPSHLPPEELRPWPSHHHSFEDRMFPRNIPHPRDHAPSFPPETDRFGRDISKRMEYEDTRSYRRTDRHLPPAYPSREGGFQDEYPPLSGRRARGPGIPWDPRGRMHPFHDAPLMVKRRRSSEDASRSPTPLADMHSDSDSSPEPERSKSSSHRHYKSGPPSSKGSSHRGQPGKDKSKASRQTKASDGDKTKHLSRKEKLLQELEAINKVIEKKKSKKRYH